MSSNSRNVKLPFLTTSCLYQGGRSVRWSAKMSSNSRNVKLSFLTTRCHYWGERSSRWSANMSSNSTNVKLLSAWAVRTSMWIFQYESQIAILSGVDLQVQGDLQVPLDLPMWALTVKVWKYHCRHLYWGGWSARWSANMSSNSRNVKLSFLTTRCHYWGERSSRWSANMSSNSTNVKLLSAWAVRISMWIFSMNLKIAILSGVDLQVQGDLQVPLDLPMWALTVKVWKYHCRHLYWGVWSARWSAYMSSNSRNVKLSFLTTRCHYWGERSSRWSANMSSNSTNVKLLSAWAVRISMWIFQYESQIAILSGVDLQVQGDLQVPLDLPMWALTVKVWKYHCRHLYWGGWSARWSANMSSNSRNLKLPFLANRCLYQGGRSASRMPKS